MTTSPSQKFTSLWHAQKSRATFFKKLHAEFSSARARRAVFESRVLTLFFPTDEGLSTSRNVLKEHKKLVSVKPSSYRVMEHLGSLETTQEARVALGYRLGQLLCFFRALQDSRVLHNSIVHAKAWTNC